MVLLVSLQVPPACCFWPVMTMFYSGAMSNWSMVFHMLDAVEKRVSLQTLVTTTTSLSLSPSPPSSCKRTYWNLLELVTLIDVCLRFLGFGFSVTSIAQYIPPTFAQWRIGPSINISARCRVATATMGVVRTHGHHVHAATRSTSAPQQIV